jgi:hypothetical protein
VCACLIATVNAAILYDSSSSSSSTTSTGKHPPSAWLLAYASTCADTDTSCAAYATTDECRAVDCRRYDGSTFCIRHIVDEGTSCREGKGKCGVDGTCTLQCPFDSPNYFEFVAASNGAPRPDRPGTYAVGYTEVLITNPNQTNSNTPRNASDPNAPPARLIHTRVWYPSDADVPPAAGATLVTYGDMSFTCNGSFVSAGFPLTPSTIFAPSPLGARWLRAPAAGTPNSRQLLVVAHPGSSGTSSIRFFGELAASHGFVVIAPLSPGNSNCGGGFGQVNPYRYDDIVTSTRDVFARAVAGTEIPFAMVNASAGYGCKGCSRGSETCLTMAGSLQNANPANARPVDPLCRAVITSDTNSDPKTVRFSNISVPVFFYQSGLAQLEPELAMDLVPVAQKYLAILPGARHFESQCVQDCDPAIAFSPWTEGRNTSALTTLPAFAFLHCGCDAMKRAVREFPPELYRLGAVQPYEFAGKVVDSLPTTGVPRETYRNLHDGYALAFMAAYTRGETAYATGYLTQAYAAATFPTSLLLFYEYSAPSAAAHPLDIAPLTNVSAITFDRRADDAYAVRYWPSASWSRPLFTPYGTLATTSGWDDGYVAGSPFELAQPFGFPLPPPDNRTQGPAIKHGLWVHMNGYASYGINDENPNEGRNGFRFQSGFIERFGTFVFMPLHVDLFDSTVAGSGIYVYNDASVFVVTWDRVATASQGKTLSTGVHTPQTFQMQLWANGTVVFAYSNGMETAGIPSQASVFSIGVVGVSDGQGAAGKQHPVDFSTLTGASTPYSVGSIYEVFNWAYSAPPLPSSGEAYVTWLSSADSREESAAATVEQPVE